MRSGYVVQEISTNICRDHMGFKRYVKDLYKWPIREWFNLIDKTNGKITRLHGDYTNKGFKIWEFESTDSFGIKDRGLEGKCLQHYIDFIIKSYNMCEENNIPITITIESGYIKYTFEFSDIYKVVYSGRFPIFDNLHWGSRNPIDELKSLNIIEGGLQALGPNIVKQERLGNIFVWTIRCHSSKIFDESEIIPENLITYSKSFLQNDKFLNIVKEYYNYSKEKKRSIMLTIFNTVAICSFSYYFNENESYVKIKSEYTLLEKGTCKFTEYFGPEVNIIQIE